MKRSFSTRGSILEPLIVMVLGTLLLTVTMFMAARDNIGPPWLIGSLIGFAMMGVWWGCGLWMLSVMRRHGKLAALWKKPSRKKGSRPPPK